MSTARTWQRRWRREGRIPVPRRIAFRLPGRQELSPMIFESVSMKGGHYRRILPWLVVGGILTTGAALFWAALQAMLAAFMGRSGW